MLQGFYMLCIFTLHMHFHAVTEHKGYCLIAVHHSFFKCNYPDGIIEYIYLYISVFQHINVIVEIICLAKFYKPFLIKFCNSC